MTEISEAAKAKARDFLLGGTLSPHDLVARFIQEVSDAAKELDVASVPSLRRVKIRPFILPEPVDPLETALNEALIASEAYHHASPDLVRRVRENLAKRGLEIRPVQS